MLALPATNKVGNQVKLYLFSKELKYAYKLKRLIEGLTECHRWRSEFNNLDTAQITNIGIHMRTLFQSPALLKRDQRSRLHVGAKMARPLYLNCSPQNVAAAHSRWQRCRFLPYR